MLERLSIPLHRDVDANRHGRGAEVLHPSSCVLGHRVRCDNNTRQAREATPYGARSFGTFTEHGSEGVTELKLDEDLRRSHNFAIDRGETRGQLPYTTRPVAVHVRVFQSGGDYLDT